MFKLKKYKISNFSLSPVAYGLIFSSLFIALPASAEWSANAALKDPTSPFSAGSPIIATAVSDAAPEQYKLSSILVRKNKRIAVLNSQRVSEGDRIGDAVVVSIEKELVNLSIAGESRVLSLYQNSIKTFLVNESRNLVVINP